VSRVWRVAWYRFRSTFDRRWGGLLALVLLVGLVGGLAMGAVAAARRTQSSFPAYLASTNPSDLSVVSYNPAGGSNAGYDPSLVRAIGRLPLVKRAESLVGLNIAPLGTNGAAVSLGTTQFWASADGEFFDLDRVSATQGRLSSPGRPNEVVLSAEAAKAFAASGSLLDRTFPAGVYTNAQKNDPAYGTPRLRPHLRLNVKFVGIVKFNDTVVQDDVDATQSLRVLLTPTLTRPLLTCCVSFTATLVQLDHHSRDVPMVVAEIERILPKGDALLFQYTSTIEAKTEQAIKPESIALGVFGAIAALVVLFIAAQMIGRQRRARTDDLAILSALGASRSMIVTDGLIGIVGAIVIGALAAMGVAVGLSPLSPIGPVRAVYPSPGIAFDWTVLGLGAAGLIVALSAVAVAVASLGAPDRVARRSRARPTRTSRAARLASASGLRASAVTGIRFALEPGSRSAVPVRSTIMAAAVAISVVTATLTFGASLHALVARPALYGWNWTYELVSAGLGTTDIPQQPADRLLARDPNVAASADVSFAELNLDGHTEPILGTSPNATVAPPTLTGHGLDAPDQIVLGTATLTALHKHVGDTVTLSNSITAPTELRIVGTATMPTVGQAGALHTTMGTGALLDYHLIPASLRNAFKSPVAGPEAIFVRVKPGANATAALQSLQRIAATPSVAADGQVSVLSVQHPAEIVNYRSMGTTPALLGAALAIGAVAALTLTLVASVRRRRRELALLKTLGFTRRDLAAVIAWQSTIAVSIGVVIGVPVGVLLGRSLWDFFARAIHAVPEPTVPGLTIALIAVGALALANLVAAIPALQAAHTPTAVLLHAE